MTLLPASARLVAVDAETTGAYPDEGARVASVSVAWLTTMGVRSKAFNFGHPGKTSSNNDYAQLLHELENKQIVMHNAAYDLVMLHAGTAKCVGMNLIRCLHWDTMLAHRVLFPVSEAGLDLAAKEVGLQGKQGVEELQGWLKEHKFKKYEYAQAPWELAGPYVTADAEQTIELYEKQMGIMQTGTDRPPEMLEVEIQREFDLTRVLTALELRGVGYDVAASRALAGPLLERADALEATMPFKCGINQAKAYFFDECGLVPDRHSEKTGKPSLDKEQVRDWSAEGVPWVKEYKEVTWARRAVARWYQGYADKCGADGRLRVRYTQAEVTSGRLSAKRVNLQAMPKKDKIEQDIAGPRNSCALSADTNFGRSICHRPSFGLHRSTRGVSA